MAEDAGSNCALIGDEEDGSSRFVEADSALVRNLAAIWGADSRLARLIENELSGGEAYSIEAAKDGSATVAVERGEGKRLYLHSRHRPMEEAEKLVERAAAGEKVVFCVMGFGLGYHVEALFERASEEAIIVVAEGDLRMLRTGLEARDYSKMLGSGRVIFQTSGDGTALLRRLSDQQAVVAMGVEFVEHGASAQLRPGFYAEARRAVEEFVAFARTNISTLVLNGKRTCENIARNLGWYAAARGINELQGKHAGKPAIIVSAGPSLRKNKHLLKEARESAVIVAVQTTLQPLLEMGVEPDYVTSLDYHEICTRFFEKLPGGLATELVAEPKASAAVLGMYPGPVRVLGNDFADRLLGEMKLGKDRLRAGATVAHLAFYLAEYLGCDPIIFVGQDLGFGDGLCYAPGTSYEDVWRPELGRFCTVEMKQWEQIARDRRILRKIPDQHGRAMYTEQRLFSYLQQFERDFATSKAKIVDATEGGALKRGAEVMTLAEAMERFFVGEIHRGVTEGAEACLGQWGRLKDCVESLKKRKREAEEIGLIGRETLALLREVRGCVEDQGRVNRLIARIDSLRARMMELNDCYELVTQLSQDTEYARFQHDRKLAASRAEGMEKQRRQLGRDIANVEGVVKASEAFIALMEETIAGLEREMDRRAAAGRGR